MIKVFYSLKNMEGKEFVSPIKNYYRQREIENIYQFIFACEVFFELKFFSVNGGILVVNQGIKKDLADSKIYKMIKRLKENV